MSLHPQTTRWRPVLLAALLALGFSGQPIPWGPAAAPAPGAPAAEEATPDASAAGAVSEPRRQRAERLADLGAQRWHAAGFRGKGVKVAVLDTGFRGYRAQLGKALPASVTIKCFRADGDLEARDSQHGILCAEVIHALAPEAELLLATWEPNQPAQFLQAADWARRQGARVLSCSVIMPSWGDGEGGGPIHDKLRRILGSGQQPGDVLCFASAGNTARRHWSGHFVAGGDGCHEWEPGQVDNRVRPWGEDRVSVELCCPPACRYLVEVYDAVTGVEVGRGASGGAGRAAAVARFLPATGRRYRARVKLVAGPAQPFHLVVLGGELEYSSPRGSVAFPGDSPEVVAVGAVDEDGQRLSYSACGPNSTRPKPDFVAQVPFTTFWRARPFTGTSAAAPQVAGLAALSWSRYPEWTAAQLRQALQRWCRDLGDPGHDCETGFGLAILPPLAEERDMSGQ